MGMTIFSAAAAETRGTLAFSLIGFTARLEPLMDGPITASTFFFIDQLLDSIDRFSLLRLVVLYQHFEGIAVDPAGLVDVFHDHLDRFLLRVA